MMVQRHLSELTVSKPDSKTCLSISVLGLGICIAAKEAVMFPFEPLIAVCDVHR